MKPNETEAFVEILAGVHEFYGKPMSGFAVEVWIKSMQGFDLTAIRDAFGRHAMNPESGQFLPKPADVVRMIDGGTADSALVAWSKFDRAVRSVGAYMSVVFDDPIIHRVIEDMGGWTGFATKQDDEWPFLRNEFVTRYRGYAQRRASIEFKPKMLGLIDAERALQGLVDDHQNTRLIGLPAKASEVMRLGTNTPSIGITSFAESGFALAHEAASRAGGSPLEIGREKQLKTRLNFQESAPKVSAVKYNNN